MEMEREVLSFILHFTITTFLLCSVLLWVRRDENNKPRRYLAITTLASGLCFLLRLLFTESGMPSNPTVLPLANLHLGLLAMLLLYLYPIEIISPGWLTRKRTFFLFLPWVFLTLLLAVLRIQFRELLSFHDAWQHVDEFNVWLRLLILATILPYSFMLFYLPHNWMKSSVTHRWIYFYTFGVMVLAALYTTFMLTCSVMVSIAHLTYCIFFILVVTYQDLFLRIEVPAGRQGTSPVPAIATTVTSKRGNPSNPLLAQLNSVMESEELWRNPDLDLEELASHLNTNRTTLTQLIRQEGYTGYKEFINSRRIDELLKMVDSGKLINVQDAFFEVGFRSRATALRYFREYTGTTPTDYIQKNGGK